MGDITKAPRGAIGVRLCNELEGLLMGIKADTWILPQETARIVDWLDANRTYADAHPFRELAAKLTIALGDGRLSSDEIEDLLFVASKYTTVNPYFDQIRAGLQVLMGLLSGYAADARLHEAEVQHLSQWVEDWGHLKGLWPYDECETIVTWMLANKRIPEEAASILDLSRCVPVGGAPITDVPALTLAGICAIQPEIVFPERQFVFTGDSLKCDRAEMERRVFERKGQAHPRITKEIDYLVVCNAGSPHWAFSCYGRKVEKAFELRREGHKVVIVHESDFWDALVV